MNYPPYYFLKFTIFNSFLIIRDIIIIKSYNEVYYIERSFGGKLFQLLFSFFWKVKFEKLYFELRNIKDKNGELVRLRIHRKDLFEIKDKIVKSKNYKDFFNYENYNNGRVSDYIEKRILSGYINSPKINTFPKILFLINVISMHIEKKGHKGCVLVIEKQPWKDQLVDYAKKLNVGLLFTNISLLNLGYRDYFIYSIRRIPRLFVFIKGLGKFPIRSNKKSSNVKLYIEGRGHLNFNNDGYNSDFFLLNNSKLSTNSIAYKYTNSIDKIKLHKNGIYSVNGFTKYHRNPDYIKINAKSNFNSGSRLDNHSFTTSVNKYLSDKSYWYSFFNYHNIKIHLTWYDNNEDHMVIADAVKEIGGVSAIWQTSFQGYRNFECKTNTDIMFLFSKFDSEINKLAGSKNKYNIITGLISNDNKSLLETEAQKIRNRLISSGAQKIVCVMDENSANDARWHTGHELQRENYRFVLEKVLGNPWLGVVFKPKKSNTLYRRLGSVNNLLSEAKKTGRCIVLDKSGKHVSNVPAILGGLVADVTIHGHLSAGTAALECALHGKRTLLIDREGAPFSKLNELPKGSVVFDNWSDAIEALINYFKMDAIDPEFGDWSDFIKEYNPFNDNKGSYRMSLYMQDLLDGFNKGLDRKIIMEDAAQKYADRWGLDKVVSA